MSFAIVTPSFNKAKYLRRSLLSVLTQNEVEIDYLVLDNCSTDGSVEILHEMQSQYPNQLRLIIEPDEGQTAAINRGFNLTSGDIMGWLNADDFYLPGTLSKVEMFFRQNPSVDLLYGKTRILDGDFSFHGEFPVQPPNVRSLKSFDYISQPAAFWRRSTWDSVGPLDISLYWGMDWDFFIRVSKNFRMEFLDEFLAEAVCDGQHKCANAGPTLTKELARIGRRHGGLQNPTYLFCQFMLALHWIAGPFLRSPPTATVAANLISRIRAWSMTLLSDLLNIQVMS